MIKDRVIERLDPEQVKALGADLRKDNEYITETAGFIPLEVKLKQFEQNGLIAQFSAQDFDSHDYRDIYLNPDFNPTPEDDFEDIQEKIAARHEFIEKLKMSKNAALGGNIAESDKSAAKAAEQKESVDTESKDTK